MKNETISGILSEAELANLTNIDKDNTTFIKSNLAITNGINTTIPNLFETILLAYEQLADVFAQIGTINEQIASINEQIAALSPPE